MTLQVVDNHHEQNCKALSSPSFWGFPCVGLTGGIEDTERLTAPFGVHGLGLMLASLGIWRSGAWRVGFRD